MDIDDELLQLYFMGDRLGASVEGMGPGTVPYEQLMQRQWQYPNGTDESDSVRCFVSFANGYKWSGDYEAFAVGWASYITRHHAATSYGRAWRDLFATVKAFEASGGITFDQLTRISRDRNSMGNGCLALAYPCTVYAREVAADPLKLAQAVTMVSHAHPLAQKCVAALVRHFLSGEQIPEDCFPPVSVSNMERWEHTPICPGCLWAAVECSKGETQEEIIRRAVEIGGDTDSYLSIALVLWSVRKQPTEVIADFSGLVDGGGAYRFL